MPGDSDLRLKRVSVIQLDQVERIVQDVREMKIEFELVAYRDLAGVAISLIISNSKGDGVLHTQSDFNETAQPLFKGNTVVTFTLPPLLLAADNYSITVAAHIPHAHTFFLERDIASFQVETSNSEILRYPENSWEGVLNPQIGEWTYMRLPIESSRP